ncbi:DUF3089 domain-containing protein [Conexibacter sp. W3-3-2]|uniref:DUF3089 domain-containing protein n=1 Tax=Conexibacter sp. W3-3-2 TaxID=2675227 RepID=UPI0012B7B7A2|nr:DUF3089 domain-containing protein [Conexibacter sp. W3-3-2]MTD43965.1 DUF3089 domain-containing protein [Conexibacter sp. W3-3-2]
MGRGTTMLVALLGAAVIAACGGAPPASAEVVWLCDPIAAAADDPCRDTLRTTVQEADGTSRVTDEPLPAAPAADCFYVYPTVSQQLGTNADKARDPELVAIARYQASRFSRECRVFAPIYRQLTLASILTGSVEARRAGFALAYGDVLEAWRAFLARTDGTRPIVLLSHSQGTRMLRKLVREEVDPSPALRARLASAVLLGQNVTVRRGDVRGGDFQQIPGCTTVGQASCVIAYSTFDDTPPDDARFGIVPRTDDFRSGFPVGDDFEVLCTNPASLGANERRVTTSLARTEPYPGVLGLGLAGTYGGTPPTADTAWVRPAERYTARCERLGRAHVLDLGPVGSARALNPFPDATWGLHITDVNIALGDLVDLVGASVRTVVAGRARAAVRVRTAFTAGRDARGRRCARRDVLLTVDGTDVVAADARVGGRRVARDTRPPVRLRVRRAALRRGARTAVTVRVTLRDGRTTTLTRRVRACGATA